MRICVSASVHRVHLKPLTSIIILFISRLSYYHHHHHWALLFSLTHRFHRFSLLNPTFSVDSVVFQDSHEFFARSEMSFTVECMDFKIQCNAYMCDIWHTILTPFVCNVSVYNITKWHEFRSWKKATGVRQPYEMASTTHICINGTQTHTERNVFHFEMAKWMSGNF